ncbi:hypothetical protein EIN_398190 [Entamoeba invadens IP1]|uniref:Myotubularin n=1 Tax=Entamoeba invadens IP1 TaxID=370355 RepID=A0A0A1UFS8_ENTIV|nr:hypothetical protein EIN_398190 [Entamoeba invadens IP1]ELP91889.1 hypothetical protein EIN_398190 [Entamoeba invadens IP1]|eukprot:XP_004258660.1 hypothetical protein EIN_398190 [Entamoeba invadens IP1]
MESLYTNTTFQKNARRQRLLKSFYLPLLSTTHYIRKGKVLMKNSNIQSTTMNLVDTNTEYLSVTLMTVSNQMPYLYVYVTENQFSLPFVAIQLPPLSLQLLQDQSGFTISQTDQNYTFYTSIQEEAVKWVSSINKTTLRSIICSKNVITNIVSPRKGISLLNSPRQQKVTERIVLSPGSILTSYNNEINPIQRKFLKDQLRMEATLNLTGLIQSINERHLPVTLPFLFHVLITTFFGVEPNTLEKAIGPLSFYSENAVIDLSTEISNLRSTLILGLIEDGKIPDLHAYAKVLNAQQKMHVLNLLAQKCSAPIHLHEEYNLFHCEKLELVVNEMVHLHFNKEKSTVKPIFGTLLFTSARIIFLKQNDKLDKTTFLNFSTPNPTCNGTFFVPVTSIKKVKIKSFELASNKFSTLLVLAKNFYKFYIGYFKDEQDAVKLLNAFSAQEKSAQSEIFSLPQKEERSAVDESVDQVSRVKAEFIRMGVLKMKSVQLCDLKICPTYPPCVAVPSKFSECQLIQSAQFRSKGRIPVISYLIPSLSVLCRSSQPGTGVLASRSSLDEQILDEYANMSKNKVLKIFDARPKLNANVNRVKGMGSENTKNYANSTLTYLNIDNIHKMREAEDLLYGVLDSNFEGVEGWLKHITKILKGAIQITKEVISGNSVLVHCSDGWDRTAQLVCLSMILVDPYYRTFDGFGILIEKEWCLIGHKFSDRSRNLGSNGVSESAPIFLQFVDCVVQVMKVYPDEFEFSEEFLKELMFQVYSCYCYNFRFNCFDEFVEFGKNTKNVFEFIKKDLFDKKFFNANCKMEFNVMPIDKLEQLQPILWKEYYMCFRGCHTCM